MSTLVLLVNLGAPGSLAEVAGFLRSMTGRDLPSAAIEALTERYRAIGGASPLAAITGEQAILLTEATGRRYAIVPAFRYSRPSLEERISEAYTSGIGHIVLFVMSPYYTSRTVGGYVKAVEEYLEPLPYAPKVTCIHSWYREPAFVRCWVEKIEAARQKRDSFYLFSAHSLPQSLAAGDPYMSQVEEMVRAVAEALTLGDNYRLGWQSVPQGAREPWIGPSVEDILDTLPGRVSRVIEVPIGFVSDHLETRYDMDVVHHSYAERLGIEHIRVSCLNTDRNFIQALAAILDASTGGNQ